jgi:hypothetical protein
VKGAIAERALPKLFPLFQAPELGLARQLRERLGERWRFTAFGVNPFTPPEVIKVLADQIVVGQFPVGSPSGIDIASSQIIVDHSIAGIPLGASFSVSEFRIRLDDLPQKTVRILLGPADPTWSLAANRERVVRASELAFR